MASFLSGQSSFGGRLAGIDSVRFAGNLPAEVELEMARHSSHDELDRWGGFFGGDHGTMTVKGDGNGEGYKATFDGLTAAGVDYRANHNLVLGLLLGYQGTSVDADGGSRLKIQGGQAGLYALLKSRGFYAQILGEGGKNTYDSQRASFDGTATGNTDGTMLSGQLGLGYRLELGKWALGPMAGIQYTQVDMKGFTETGSLAPETFGDQGDHSLMSNLGARVSGIFNLSRSMTVIPAVSGSWMKELHNKGGDITSSIGGDSFTVLGSQIGQSGFQLQGGLGVQWKSGFNLSAQYQKDFGRDRFDAQTIGGQVQFKL
jgi:outer membrane autotransporter protein